ncbi:MAG: TatD family hydrolase [Acetanaerobacterium sp.]
MNNIFDSHAHYNDELFDEDREQVLSSLGEGGVRAVINAACDMSSARTGLAYTREYNYFFCAVGIHPQSADEYTTADLNELAALCEHQKVVAIGEIGLDYHYETPDRDTQKAAFAAQLSLARQTSMPVILHNREATADMMPYLKKYRPKGVMHCFSGSADTAKELLAMGMYLGYTGVVTFSNAKRVLEAVAATPLDRLLLETDCPYMAPTPLRGKRSDSRMIAITAAKIAEIKGIETQELINKATENTCRLFGINLDEHTIA